MKRKHLLPLILITPLLMANSPAPYPTEIEYEDIDVSVAFIERTEDEGYKYSFEIENKGESYSGIFERYSTLNDEYLRVTNVEGKLFEDEMIAPGLKKTYQVTIPYELELLEEGNKWSSWTFSTIDEEVVFENPTLTLYDENRYTFAADIENLGDYYYYAVIELEYNGETYVTFADLSYEMRFIRTTEELDLENVTIKKVSAYRSTYQRYHIDIDLSGLLAGFLGFVSVAGTALILIAAAILIPVVVITFKEKKDDKIR